jgi:O-antigen/teichoic acid export membrane protein
MKNIKATLKKLGSIYAADYDLRFWARSIGALLIAFFVSCVVCVAVVLTLPNWGTSSWQIAHLDLCNFALLGSMFLPILLALALAMTVTVWIGNFVCCLRAEAPSREEESIINRSEITKYFPKSE